MVPLVIEKPKGGKTKLLLDWFILKLKRLLFDKLSIISDSLSVI
jgi:hypothetical protein